ncbi:hypothetical protein FNF29_00490 [Cafeteria roenbergensis]|uniref:Uncharacterized protein n=1 Tax=Cafeteria roenbergensis TaxID=33653 RepID=A0A5A8CWL2_CAFRO|nr:hypothetical protein FNF29_00490 [Cafeteria roenbergensis]|eukprot:KAA0157138.1 hypothetical protein FNF29_00490 [Cafeteria roenbergensis]
MATSSAAADAAQEDRRAEERAVLAERLRRSLATVVEDNNDLREYNATLKKSQSQLLERTTELSELVDRLRGELSNAAAANARLKRDLADTKQALERETAQAGSLSSELNAYRETEGAIATALAAVTAKGSGGASPGADGSAPVGEDGVPAWLEAEARAGGEARARSLKLQVLALRQALFRVARKAVSRGADSAQVADYISEAVDGGRAEEREEEEVVEEEEEEASGDDGDVVMPPAPIDVVHATVEDEDTPKTQTPLSDQGDASTNAAVGLLGMVLAPPIVLADALAAVSEAFFGAEEDEEGFEED